MHLTKFHIGLRTVKTAIAVTLALTIGEIIKSTMPIFCAIGAISAMSRTITDSLSACLTQFAGTVCGCVIGCIFMLIFPSMHTFLIGIGVLIVILIGIRLKINYAIPLSCIVFVSICLNDNSVTPLNYSIARFFDTSIGLIIALIINILIKPYNNRKRISNLITHFTQAYPEYLRDRVVFGRYPNLKPLKKSLKMLDTEIEIFERQRRLFKDTKHSETCAYLRGCEQLAWRMIDELSALCSMDTTGAPSKALLDRMEKMELLSLPYTPCVYTDSIEDRVLCYHLDNLLNAYEYLLQMNHAPDQDDVDDLPPYHKKFE